jgi:hypothetical protein
MKWLHRRNHQNLFHLAPFKIVNCSRFVLSPTSLVLTVIIKKMHKHRFIRYTMTYILIVFLFDITDGNIFFYKFGQKKQVWLGIELKLLTIWNEYMLTSFIKKWIKQCWPIGNSRYGVYHSHTWQSGKVRMTRIVKGLNRVHWNSFHTHTSW